MHLTFTCDYDSKPHAHSLPLQEENIVIGSNWILFWPFLASVQKQFVNYLGKKGKRYLPQDRNVRHREEFSSAVMSLRTSTVLAQHENWNGNFYSPLCIRKIFSIHCCVFYVSIYSSTGPKTLHIILRTFSLKLQFMVKQQGE